MSTVLAITLLCVAAVKAASDTFDGKSIAPLTTQEIDSYIPYTWYASTAYCNPSQTLAWNCGANCDGNSGFKPVASGGDGDAVQYWYVGYDPNLDTVIVAHQGTNPEAMQVWIQAAGRHLLKLDPTFFPDINPDIRVHQGFAAEQTKTARDVLAAVQQTMSQYDTTSVTMVGHSLGGAITLLDSVYLPLWLPKGTTFKTVCYGVPRVGNQAFTDYVDAHGGITHINNKKDPVPIVPPLSTGFVHPSGEVHIKESGVWVACPGQDNPSTQCTAGDVPNLLGGNIEDHYGPYNGITMGKGC